MKNVIIVLLFLFSASTAFTQVRFVEKSQIDTLTNADTIFVTLANKLYAKGTFECGVEATNVSGTTSAQGRIQVNHMSTGGQWLYVSTDTLAIADGTAMIISKDINATRARFRVSSTGTQSSALKTSCTFRIAR